MDRTREADAGRLVAAVVARAEAVHRAKVPHYHTLMRFFNLDLHQSVIEDVRDIFRRLYGDTVEITHWSISAHNWVFGKPDRDVQHINQDTWTDFTHDRIRLFQETYHEELSSYDGFIVCHTPVFALLYEKYAKPIIIVNSCRYDQPFCWTKDVEMAQELHACLARLRQAGLLYVVSNNTGDQHYLYTKAGIPSTHIPSLCLYVNAVYEPKKKEFVIFTGNRSHIFPSHPLLVQKPGPGYTWKELYEYRGLVHSPYEMSTMSIFEQYWAGVPQFFPTRRFYKELVEEGKMECISMYESWGEYFTERQMDAWLDHADWLTFPGLYYYDSFDDLLRQLEGFDDVHSDMRWRYISATKERVLEQWKTLLAPLIPGRKKDSQRTVNTMKSISKSSSPHGGRILPLLEGSWDRG